MSLGKRCLHRIQRHEPPDVDAIAGLTPPPHSTDGLQLVGDGLSLGRGVHGVDEKDVVRGRQVSPTRRMFQREYQHARGGGMAGVVDRLLEVSDSTRPRVDVPFQHCAIDPELLQSVVDTHLEAVPLYENDNLRGGVSLENFLQCASDNAELRAVLGESTDDLRIRICSSLSSAIVQFQSEGLYFRGLDDGPAQRAGWSR
mmetsp:Transcript_72694/g.151753  ORF Transcript_72694/g.151753 Transcript_72694/m.151753 type:complete len:200 (-) Transcript_72694:1130-1729(-)